MWSTCIDAGPKRCPLAASWDTADELEAAVWDLIYSLKENPLAVGKKKPLVVDYEKIKTLFMASFYSTLHWPGVVAAIDKIFKGELDDELTELIGALVFTTPKEAIPDAMYVELPTQTIPPCLAIQYGARRHSRIFHGSYGLHRLG